MKSVSCISQLFSSRIDNDSMLSITKSDGATFGATIVLIMLSGTTDGLITLRNLMKNLAVDTTLLIPPEHASRPSSSIYSYTPSLPIPSSNSISPLSKKISPNNSLITSASNIPALSPHSPLSKKLAKAMPARRQALGNPPRRVVYRRAITQRYIEQP